MISGRKSGFTLVEVIFTMVLLSLFMFVLTQVFNVTYRAYQHNRLLAGKMYAKSNIDGLFSIIEEELKYSGSQNKPLNALFGLSGDDLKAIKIEDSDTLITKYALAEKIILTRDYPDSGGHPNIYLALFDAYLPASRIEEGEGLWALTYDNLDDPTDAESDKITAYKSDETTKVNDKQGIELTFEDGSTLDYVSPLIYESSFGILSDSEIDDAIQIKGAKWYGEIIYKTRIYLAPPDDTLETSSIKMEREIPTINKTYTVNILDSVESFNIELDTENPNVYHIEVVYFVPGFEEATFTKSRTFYDWSAD